MSRLVWRVGSIFLIFLLLLQFNNFGEILVTNPTQETTNDTSFDDNSLEIAPTEFDAAVTVPPAAWITGGDADWLIDTSTYSTGVSSLRSGNIGDTEDSWIETTIEGPAIISFDWKVSSEENWDYLRFYIDGSQQIQTSGLTSWTHKSYTIGTWGSHVLRWAYTKDYSISRYSDCGWIDNLLIQDVDYALESPELTWTSGGNADWFIRSSYSSAGSTSMQSGNIGDTGVTFIETTIDGPAIVTFDWKVSSEHNYDYLKFYIDGSQQDLISGTTSWLSESYTINSVGVHTLRWAYTKDLSISRYSDCGWIDNLQIQDIDSVLEEPGLAWSTGGSLSWVIDTTTYNEGGSSLRSGDLGLWGESWVQTTVRGPVTVSFDWKVSSEAGGDYLRFFVDGTEITQISGLTSWSTRTYYLASWGTHTLQWIYDKDLWGTEYSDCGWLDNIVIEDVDATVEHPGLIWDSGGNAEWALSSVHSVGSTSMRSGDIGNLGNTWIETTVEGPVVINFDWRVASEAGADYLRFYIDGIQQAYISGYRGWSHQTYTINSWGSHTLRWSYTKSWFNSHYSDSGWIDNVKVNPLDDAVELELPTKPENLQLNYVDGEVELTWDAPVFLGDSPFIGYKVHRGTTTSSLYEYASPEGTSFTDSDLDELTSYYYRVTAINNVGESPYSSLVSVYIPDDDTTAPTITWEYFGDKEDGSPGYIEVEASDDSGLSVDPTGTYNLDSTLGDQIFTFTATDADNDRPDDSLTTTVVATININDDDTTPPEITWEYVGGNTDGDAGYITVSASDDSGLSMDPSGTYYLLNDLGTQNFNFTAVDADNDRPDDQLKTTVLVDITVDDDDVTPPEITWEYFGSYTDGDPGYIEVTATDASGLSIDPSGTYYLLADLGTQTFEFTATDADNDREDDSLSTTITVTIDITDDDTTAPEINWEYYGSYTDGDPGYIVVIASDASGLDIDPSGIYYLTSDWGEQIFEFIAVDADTDTVDDQLSTTITVTIEIADDDMTAPEITWEYFGSSNDGDPGYIEVTAYDASGLDVDPSGTYYLTSDLGEQTFEFTAVDADTDTPGDQLSTTISVTIEITDDDTTAPEVVWDYFGSYTDGDPGYIVVEASDASGLSVDPTGTYYLPSDLGVYFYEFTATDADTDSPGDQLTTTVTVSIEISDDDTIAPEITYEYFGSNTDEDPGYIEVAASDASGLLEDPSGIYYLSSDLGEQVFSFTAIDADSDRADDELSTTVTVTIEIFDDDTTAPVVDWEYYGSYTDGDPGYIEVTASDESGLDVDPSGTYYLSTNLGDQTFTFEAIDADMDRTDDQLSTSITVTITISDDDTIAPVITWEYFGDGTDGNPGYIEVTAYDDSGLSEDPSGIYYLSVDLGEQTFTFVAVDADEDRVGDTLSTTVIATVEIIDDDTTAPEILIEYIDGDGTDGNPGYFAWTLSDIDDGIGGDSDTGFSDLEIWIDFISCDGLSDYSLSLPADETGEWYLPTELGQYTINVFAQDNDDDRTHAMDSLSSESSLLQEIVDDDIDAPVLTDLLLEETESLLILSFNATDASGIADIEITFDGLTFIPLSVSNLEESYTYEYSKDILFYLGIGEHTIEIHLTDGDDDRPFDSLTSTYSETFTISVENLLEFIKYELLLLKAEVHENVDHPFGMIIEKKLDKTIWRIDTALQQYLKGHISCALMLERLSKVYIEIIEIITKVGDWCDKIDAAFADYLVDRLHVIRDHITFAMASSIGTASALAIGSVEIMIDQLADGLYDDASFWSALIIDVHLSQASRKLDQVLIQLARGHDRGASRLLDSAIRDLYETKCWIQCLVRMEKLPSDLAEGLLLEINGFITSLEEIDI